MSTKKLTDEELDAKILKSVDKIPCEMKKVKVFLFFLSYFNSLKKLFNK